MTFQEFKETYARSKKGFSSWENYILYYFRSKSIDETEIEYNDIAIEFAKLHVAEALKKASENAKAYCYTEWNAGVDEDSILNSYNLDNIQ